MDVTMGQDSMFARCVGGKIGDMGYDLSSYKFALLKKCGKSTEKGMISGGDKISNGMGIWGGLVVLLAVFGGLC